MITIDTEKCVRCGDCARICPVRVYNRIVPPCQAACPIGTDAEGYLSLIVQGKFAEALALNRLVNPMPLTVGRICSHPCETKCHRGKVEEPIAICSLKRFVGDEEIRTGEHQSPAPAPRTHREKVAIVGSGPAGLAAAHSLALAGYPVTVFEAELVAGGMLAWGIPEFRLPKDVVKIEIDDIRALGVRIQTGTRVASLDDLKAKGFKAILLAVGAQQCRILGIPGESGSNVMHCLELMRKVSLGQKVRMGRNVVVIGGGNVAVDGARTALRLGAKKVTLVCLESRETMPAGMDEIKGAEEEGIAILPSRQCLRILREREAVAGVECVKLRSMRFEAGKLITDRMARSEHVISADMIIVAIGQAPDVAGLGGFKAADVGSGSRLKVDPVSMSISEPGVFAAGDAVSGPATVIEAIAAGKRAAVGIDRYLRRKAIPKSEPAPAVVEPMIDRVWGDIQKRQRQLTLELSGEARTASFDEVNQGFDAERAVAEAGRCLGCGVFGIVDMSSCCGTTCALCMDACWKQAIIIAPDERSLSILRSA